MCKYRPHYSGFADFGEGGGIGQIPHPSLFTRILHLKTFAIFWRCPQFSDYQCTANCKKMD
jgi:hypothetical protein